MEYIYQWLIQPILTFMNYPIKVFTWGFTIKDIIFFDLVFFIFCKILRLATNGSEEN